MNTRQETLTIQTEQRGDVQVVRVFGAMDYWSIGPLREELNRHLSDEEASRVVLDLYGVPYCDSSGLSLLLTAQQRAEAAGGWLRIARPHLQIRRVLAVTRLDRHIHGFRSVEEAIAGRQEP